MPLAPKALAPLLCFGKAQCALFPGTAYGQLHALRSVVQVLVPLAAKVVLLPASREALAPVQLPVTQANSYKDPLEDLVVLMLHSRK